MYLGTNIRHLRKVNKLSQGELAELVKSKTSTISNYEIGNNEPRIETLNLFSKIFGISIDDLINKDLRGNSKSSTDLNVNKGKISYLPSKNILVPIKAQAGYLENSSQERIDQNLIYVSIPGIRGEARTFEIDGDSMAPIIVHGDLVSGNKVEHPDLLKNKMIYVVVAPSFGIVAKYLERHKDGLHLISQDKENFPTIICEYEDVKEIWEVKIRITTHLKMPENYIYNDHLMLRIKRLEDIMDKNNK